MIADAGPGAPELGVRARAEAMAASATEWHDSSMTAAGQQLFIEYMFTSELSSSWRLMVISSPRAERRALVLSAGDAMPRGLVKRRTSVGCGNA